jgi:hypothetical protein
MKALFNTLVAAFIMLAFSSCYSNYNPISKVSDLPKAEKKLVIVGYISPDEDSVWVNVRRSIPLYSDINPGDYNNITNAQVVLSGEFGTRTLDLHSTGWYCTSRNGLGIEAGKRYTINVKVTDYPEASASCVIPERADFQLSGEVNQIDGQYRLNMKWVDDAARKNYYEYDAYYFVADSFTGYTYRGRPYWESDDNLIDDNKLEGKTLSVSNVDLGTNFFGSSLREVNLELYNIDYAGYMYNFSIRRSFDDAFGTPMPVYTNVTGGLGIFSAYTKTENVIQVK